KIDRTMPSAAFTRLTADMPRRQAAQLIQIRTGHIALNKHLFKIGKADSPMCTACRGADEACACLSPCSLAIPFLSLTGFPATTICNVLTTNILLRTERESGTEAAAAAAMILSRMILNRLRKRTRRRVSRGLAQKRRYRILSSTHNNVRLEPYIVYKIAKGRDHMNV
ncbi:hypothetical protein JB92DRAFT_2758627, partial [Gautieria morchelliformis]